MIQEFEGGRRGNLKGNLECGSAQPSLFWNHLALFSYSSHKLHSSSSRFLGLIFSNSAIVPFISAMISLTPESTRVVEMSNLSG
jgi:hypothetical protein